MMAFVVDTNVLIIANRRVETPADIECQLTCVEALESLVAQGVVAIDDRHGSDCILAEYGKYANRSGGPAVGDVFYKHVLDNQYLGRRVLRVPVTPSQNDRRGFEELPDNDFDPSDRKFLAVAVVAKATVLNATDSDWGEQAALMDTLGIEVRQLCPQHASK